jgi:hypothetical protein
MNEWILHQSPENQSFLAVNYCLTLVYLALYMMGEFSHIVEEGFIERQLFEQWQVVSHTMSGCPMYLGELLSVPMILVEPLFPATALMTDDVPMVGNLLS